MSFPHAQRDILSAGAPGAGEVECEDIEAVRESEREENSGFDAARAVAVQIDDGGEFGDGDGGRRHATATELTAVEGQTAGVD